MGEREVHLHDSDLKRDWKWASSNTNAAPLHESDKSTDSAGHTPASSSFDSRSPQSSVTSIAPPRAEEWDRTLRHTGLRDFGEALQNAANAVYPNDNKSRYSRVYVLLICWKTQDPKLPVEREIRELRRVFEEVYRYNTEEFEIPDSESHAAVSEKINSFVKVDSNSSGDLKIVYYAGHSRLSRTKELLWSNLPENAKSKSPIVVWSGIQRSLEMAESDVLILLDCCSSGVANASEGNGVTELICACPYDSKANGVGHYSFTNAITTELRLLSRKPCFSVGELYTSVYTRIQSYLVQGIENERYPPPVHFVLTQDEPFIRGIKLSVMDPKISEQSSNSSKRKREEISSETSSKIRRLDEDSSSSIENMVPPRKTPFQHQDFRGPKSSKENSSSAEVEAPTPKETTDGRQIPEDSIYPLDAPRALFAVRFREDVRAEDLSIELFREWLRSIPAAAEEIRVEASFKCLSTLILASVPLSMSSYMPQHPAIFSLGIVESSIIMPLDWSRKESYPIKIAGDQTTETQHEGEAESSNITQDDLKHYNVSASADGYYHCPWEDQDFCQHKPEREKSKYDKCVDSHLKPYRCLIPVCQNLYFISNSELLRHTQEAHGVRMHGVKPKVFVCTYGECAKSIAGNTFTTHWELCNHMICIHDGPEPRTRSEPSRSPPLREDKSRKAGSRTPTERVDPIRSFHWSSLAEPQYRPGSQQAESIMQKIRNSMKLRTAVDSGFEESDSDAFPPINPAKRVSKSE